MKYVPTTSLLHRLHRASQIATERLAAELGDGNLTERQIIVLAAVNADEGLSQTGIVQATGVDRSTLADIVKRLTKRGLLARKRSKKDARAYVVTLTAEGRQTLVTAAPAMAKAEAALLSGMSASQRDNMIKALDILIAHSD